MTKNQFVLIYVGDGSALPYIPARSLTEDDMQSPAVVEYGGKEALIASGLYQAVGNQVHEFIVEAEKAQPRKKDKEV